MFVIFAERLLPKDELQEEQEWVPDVYDDMELNFLNAHSIYHINQFPTFSINIDFEHPELAQNVLIELTQEVERCCPVGKYFGKEGIGEGIVWKPTDSKFQNSGYWHKVKGEKHSSSKHKTLAPIDVELVKEIEALVDIVVTESRVDQGISKLRETGKEFDIKNIGDFLRWMVGDVEKEESEMLDKSGIERKKIHKKITDKAKREFLNKLNGVQ